MNRRLFLMEIPLLFSIKSLFLLKGGGRFEKYNPRCDYIRSICLLLNNSCNLCCSYCFANKGHFDKPHEQMSLQNALKAIDTVAEIIQKNGGSKISISFFGGEPLLSFELIKEIIVYVSEKYKYLVPLYRLTTNGTLFTPEIIQFLHSHPFEIMVSIDGGKKEHDLFRKNINGKGSYDKIIKNLNLFDSISRLNARITITRANTNIADYLEELLNIGFRKITFAIDYAIEKENFLLFKKSLKRLFKKYINDIKKGFFYDITNITTVMTSVVMYYKMKTHCNAGISYITLSADGTYYRCPRFVGQELFKISTISDSSQTILDATEKYKNQIGLNAGARSKKCVRCPFVYLCGGTCSHHAFMHSHNEFDSVKLDCDQKKLIYKETLKLICKLTVEERKIFLLYLTLLWGKEVNQHE